MKRLRELPASSPLIAQAKRLIDAAPAVPASAAQMQRVRRLIDQPHVRARRATLLSRMPAFAVAGALLMFGASAFAAVRTWLDHRAARTEDAGEPLAEAVATRGDGRSKSATEITAQPLAAVVLPEAAREERVTRTSPQLVAAEADRPRARQQPARANKRARARNHSAIRARSSASRAAVKPVVAPEAPTAQEADEPTDSASAEVGEATPPRAAVEAAPAAKRVRVRVRVRVTEVEASDAADASPEPARFSPAAKRSSDSELVVRAVQTLRRDREPALAASLLARYRTRNPAGVLAEEVLSLQIEAAVAAGDPRSRAFAREYLARYPEGHYREHASRALRGATP